MALVIRSYVTHLDAPQQAATRHKAKALGKQMSFGVNEYHKKSEI
jgi:hypothetical protein